MKAHSLLIILLTLGFSSYSQIHFEKGYFIDEKGDQVECLIQDIGWRSNPGEFTYKLSETSELQTATIKSVKEFGILNSVKFQRFSVLIDRSSSNISELSKDRAPEFSQEHLFLKVLLEGQASLYTYQEGNLKRYFYKKDTSAVEQLIFKTYKPERKEGGAESRILTNKQYQQQLWNELRCDVLSVKDVERIHYKKKDLVKFFVAYNSCKNSQFTIYQKPKQKLINLSLRPGVQTSSFVMYNDLLQDGYDFGSSVGMRWGLEMEVVMPFQRNKWAIILEPVYKSYQAKGEMVDTRAHVPKTHKIIVDYQSIQLPIGIRHYFFLNDKTKLFINGFAVVDFNMNSKVHFGDREDLNIPKTSGMAVGMGFSYSRYSIEGRYNSKRTLLPTYGYWHSEYTTSVAVIFGYRFL